MKIVLKYKKGQDRILINDTEVTFTPNSVSLLGKRVYNEFVSEVIKYHKGSLFTLFSPILERNSLTNPAFFELCKVIFISDLLANGKDKITIITCNPLYFISFKATLSVDFFSKIKFFIEIFKRKLKKLIIINLLVLREIRTKFLARTLKRRSFSVDNIFLSWVNEKCFDSLTYKDAYFSGLEKFLPNKSRSVYFSSLYGSLNISKTIKLIESDHRVTLKEVWVDYKDIFKLYEVNRKTQSLKISDITYDNLNLTDFFKYQMTNSVINDSYLFYRAFENVLKISSFNRIYFNFENLNPERSVMSAIDKSPNKIKKIGLFHTSFPTNLLNLDYPSKSSLCYISKPDVILFNCKSYCDYFVSKYDDSGIIFDNIYAYRQKNYSVRQNTFTSFEQNEVLVCLPGNKNDFYFLIDMLMHVTTAKTVVFRFHPMFRPEINDYTFNFSFRLDDSISLGSALSRHTMLVSTYSASITEASELGLSVAILFESSRLAINPLDNSSMSCIALYGYEELEVFINSNAKRSPRYSHYNLSQNDFYRTKQLLSNL
ncbi:hypothetical protein AB4169_09275 [Vibrio lentus]